MIRKFFNHEQFNFELQFARGGVHNGAADCRSLRSTKGCSQRHQRSGRTGSGGPNRTACAPPSVCSPRPVGTTWPTSPIRSPRHC